MAPNGRPGGLMCMSRGTFNGTERTTSPWAFSTPCCAAFERKCLSLTHAAHYVAGDDVEGLRLGVCMAQLCRGSRCGAR